MAFRLDQDGRAPKWTAQTEIDLRESIGACEPEELVLIRSEYPPGNNNRSLQYPWFEKFTQLTQFFDGASAVSERDRSNITDDGPAHRLSLLLGWCS